MGKIIVATCSEKLPKVQKIAKSGHTAGEIRSSLVEGEQPDRPNGPTSLEWNVGGSPGLVVMGGDSSFKGREFESRHGILDGQFSQLVVVKIVLCV